YSQEPGGLEGLRNAVVDTINDLVESMTGDLKINLNDINCVIAAGNTTMMHILLMIPPDDIRKHPYIPVATFLPVIRAAEAGIKINPRGLLACLPAVASYVGGDISAGVLASGIDDSPGLSMLIDLGTNGEIVLGNKDWLACCACSAGPAFEGVGIESGVRAMEGAIQRVRITKDFDVEYSVIGEVKPKGICGSGLVDTVGELLKSGVIDRQGKFREIKSKRLKGKTKTGNKEFVIAFANETQTQKDIAIAEIDIQNLIRSKGAVYMGAYVMLKHMGLKFENLTKIFVAGGLGTYLDIEKAIMMGLLPDLPLERFAFIGNSSIAGAKACLVSYEAMDKAAKIAKKMTYFELSTDPSFMNEYTSTLFLPHTDMDLFPSVKKILG
ncbi:MAG: ASKHA domain-containing protein, partial [Candidatus Omnitrophota bacterium]